MLLRELIQFACIGSIGLLVDIMVLYALNSTFGPFFARGFSFFVAAIATWILNRKFTFRRRGSKFSKPKEMLIYVGLMLVGGVANYLCYMWLIISYNYVEKNLFIGVAAGSLAGMLLNFSTSRCFLYR
jgi:putative flippase GtrA